jgi:hypothetical protein
VRLTYSLQASFPTMIVFKRLSFSLLVWEFMVHTDHRLLLNVPAFLISCSPFLAGYYPMYTAGGMFCIIITSKEHNKQNKVKGRKNEGRENSVRLTR